MKKILYIFSLTMLFYSCLPDEPNFEAFRRVEVQRLLSGQESKSWLLNQRVLFGQDQNIEICADSSRLVFTYTTSETVQNPLFYINSKNDCQNSTDTLKGLWYIPSTPTTQTFTDTVVFVWEENDTAFFKLDNLNPENLQISSLFPSDSLQENFIHVE